MWSPEAASWSSFRRSYLLSKQNWAGNPRLQTDSLESWCAVLQWSMQHASLLDENIQSQMCAISLSSGRCSGWPFKLRGTFYLSKRKDCFYSCWRLQWMRNRSLRRPLDSGWESNALTPSPSCFTDSLARTFSTPDYIVIPMVRSTGPRRQKTCSPLPPSNYLIEHWQLKSKQS